LHIERFGFVEKLVIRPNGQLIGGEGRLEALKRVGREQAECRVVAGLTEAG
jgi:ParB-like chromosome segregation protein Spo0J